MGLGIALVVVGVLGTAALAVVYVAASSEGALGLGTALAANPRSAALAAAVAAVLATGSFLLGLWFVARARARRGHAVVVDERAREAERDARARLLAMRLEQLQREVEAMERRADAHGLLDSSVGMIDGDDGDDEPVIVLLPEDGLEPTVLGRRLAEAEAARRPSLRA